VRNQITKAGKVCICKYIREGGFTSADELDIAVLKKKGSFLWPW